MKTDGDARWIWLRWGSVKREAGSLVVAAEEQATLTNASQEQSKCMICGKRDETASHLVIECSKMAQ